MKEKLSQNYWKTVESSVLVDQNTGLSVKSKLDLIKLNYKVLESYKMRKLLASYVGEVLTVGAVQMSDDGSNRNMIKPSKTAEGP